jgi:hypothetical protein
MIQIRYARVDRRPLDPPPVVLLRMFHVNHPGSDQETERELDYESVFLRLSCFALLNLWQWCSSTWFAMYCGFISSGTGAPIARTCYSRNFFRKPISSFSPITFFPCVCIFFFITNTESYYPTASLSSTSLLSIRLQIRCKWQSTLVNIWI